MSLLKISWRRQAPYRNLKVTLSSLLSAILLTACGGGTTVEEPVNVTAQNWQWQLPAGFPQPKDDLAQPMSQAKVTLGHYLFYDKRLSVNGTQSCGSCHQQARAFTDGKPVAIGATGEAHPRNTISLVNVVYQPTLTWANPSLVRLEQQMETPLLSEHPVEMGLTDATIPQVLAQLASDSRYPGLFQAAFPTQNQPITLANVIAAIASFQRSIITADSRYDRYLQGKATLTAAEQRGMDLFFSEKAECFHCHGGFNFTDQSVHATATQVPTPFHNTGLYHLDALGSYPAGNQGVYELTDKPSDRGAFRAPSLRNVAITAPYNHDGSTPSLEAVVAHYAAGGRVIPAGQPFAGDGRLNPNKDDLIVRIDLSQAEQADLVAFLRTLTDESVLVDPRFADPFQSKSTGAQP